MVCLKWCEMDLVRPQYGPLVMEAKLVTLYFWVIDNSVVCQKSSSSRCHAIFLCGSSKAAIVSMGTTQRFVTFEGDTFTFLGMLLVLFFCSCIQPAKTTPVWLPHQKAWKVFLSTEVSSLPKSRESVGFSYRTTGLTASDPCHTLQECLLSWLRRAKHRTTCPLCRAWPRPKPSPSEDRAARRRFGSKSGLWSGIPYLSYGLHSLFGIGPLEQTKTKQLWVLFGPGYSEGEMVNDQQSAKMSHTHGCVSKYPKMSGCPFARLQPCHKWYISSGEP